MIKKFESFVIDSILDKINDKGIHSLTKREKEILDAHAKEDEEKLNLFSKQIVVEGDLFQFVCDSIEIDEEENDTFYNGTITIPNTTDYIDGDEIEISGYIWEIEDGQILPMFEYDEDQDIVTLTISYEEELEKFLEEAVKEIKIQVKLRGLNM